ncbi:Poly A polymerase head domain, variant 2 [Balamuthia mandrillaris]
MIAQMDALRRDLTINSLFYNINEDRVEDFTGTGISDLKAGLLRTPLPAMTTLMEDPLRAMRCLRFATRFDGFKLDDELCAAIQDPAIRHELQNNISRERIATELNKLMTGPLPVKGLELLCSLNLHTIVFFPVPSQPEFWSESMTELALSSVRAIYERCEQETKGVPLKVVLLSSFFLPLFRCVDKAALDKVDFSKLSKKEQDVYLQQQLVPFTKFHMQERWMFTHKEVTLTFALLSLAEQFLQLVSAWSAQPPHERSFDRLSAGKLLRESGPKWSIAFELAQLKHSLLLSNEPASTVFHSSSLVSVYESYKQLLLDEGLLGEQPVWEMPLLFQGGELMKALNFTKPGPIVGLLKEKAIEWQILHPGGTPEQCLLSLSSFLQQHK